MTGTAAVVTVGTELVSGLVPDTNAAEVALALTGAGLVVRSHASVGDDAEALAALLRGLVAEHEVVVVTGGLGPTHDDVTREGASLALGRPLHRDETVAAALAARYSRHDDPRARERVLRQAEVLEGARVLPAVLGTAPGQVAETPRGLLALLPGPPREMRPLLEALAAELRGDRSTPRVLSCTGVTESDVQVLAEEALGSAAGVGFTVLAEPGLVRAVLLDEGAGEAGLDEAASAVESSLGDMCFSTDGSTLPQTVLRLARERGVTLALAESCTGGMVAAALTGVPGASDVFLGGIVSYADAAKATLLGVAGDTLAAHGAVSAETAREMAEGARERLGATLAVSVTGIAGPGGGSEDKPVGTVWFGLAREGVASDAVLRRFPGPRATVRALATACALDLLRRRLTEG